MDLTTLTAAELQSKLEQAKVDAKGLPFAYDALDDLHRAEINNSGLQLALLNEIERRTNTPEGLPSRLPGNYRVALENGDWCIIDELNHVKAVFFDEGDDGQNARDFAAAMNAPTPLESKLAEALKTMVYETTCLCAEDEKGRHRPYISKEALTKARAALEAWKVGHNG